MVSDALVALMSLRESATGQLTNLSGGGGIDGGQRPHGVAGGQPVRAVKVNVPHRPCWLNEHLHAVVWLVFAMCLVGAYVWMHQAQRLEYIEDNRPQVASAVRVYALRPHPVTGALQVRVDNDPYTFDPEDLGPLGIGTLPEARGVLTRASAIVERYNIALRDYIEGVRDAFYPSPNNQHYMLVDLSTVYPGAQVGAAAPRSSGEETESGEALYAFRVSVGNFSRVAHEYPNELTMDALIDLVRGATLVRAQAGKRREVVATPPDTKTPATLAACAMRHKRVELRSAVSCFFETPASVNCEIPSSTPCECFDLPKNCAGDNIPDAPGTVQDDGRASDPDGASRDDGRGGAPSVAQDNGAAGSLNGVAQDGRAAAVMRYATDASSDILKTETRFHQELRMVTERHIGFFWVSGRYLWWEIMMLAAIGVVTRKLVVFAKAYVAGEGAGPVWQPRESIETLMHFTMAPVFALVIIWILTLTNIISVKPLIGDVWSNATVPLAFLLGLFPSLGYDVLRGLADGVFGRHLVDEGPAEPRPVLIPDAPPAPLESAAASFEQLRQRVRYHATAVFRQ